ncbi:MAG TPA: M23 family metallopeptidase [Gemmatimonadaceae bacterium]
MRSWLPRRRDALSVLRVLCGHFPIVFGLACARAGVTANPPAAAPAQVALTDADIEYFGEHPLMVPVDGVTPDRVPDSFNEPRGDGRIHRATDILAPRETPVVAAIAGEVVLLRQNAAGGITAYLVDDARRYVYYYAHLAYYSVKITEGLKVPQGFVIGYVGTSGNAPPDTPHLHFQAMRLNPGQHDWWNGTPVDVRRFMTRKGQAAE